MKYLSIDIETTGLDENYCQTLQVAAYLEDTLKPLSRNKTPSFNRFIHHKTIQGNPYALNMNNWLIQLIIENKHEELVEEEELSTQFRNWLTGLIKHENNKPIKILAAGKNVGTFDARFLKKLPNWNRYFEFHHRSMDPAILFTDPLHDSEPPAFPECLKRAGIDESKITLHDARDDAWAIILLLRKGLNYG